MPLILFMADDTDGAGALATVVGSAPGSSNSIQVAQWINGALTFSPFGPLIGDGTVPIGAAKGHYAAYVQNTSSGVVTYSNVATFRITGRRPKLSRPSHRPTLADHLKKVRGWIEEAKRRAVEEARRHTQQQLRRSNQSRAAKL